MWGTNVQLYALSHSLNMSIYSSVVRLKSWCRTNPHTLDPTLADSDTVEMALYMRHPHNHYDVVTSIPRSDLCSSSSYTYWTGFSSPSATPCSAHKCSPCSAHKYSLCSATPVTSTAVQPFASLTGVGAAHSRSQLALQQLSILHHSAVLL